MPTTVRRAARAYASRVPLAAASFWIATGCAATADRPQPPTPSPRIERVSDGGLTAASMVALRPARITAGSGVTRLEDVRLYLGGVGNLTRERLALVVQVARDSANAPVLHEHRRLLLDIDGSLFLSSPVVEWSHYRYALTELGYTETVLVPIERPLLERLCGADFVTGRVGDWITFELSPEDLQPLRDFLRALPSDGHRAGALAPATALTGRNGT